MKLKAVSFEIPSNGKQVRAYSSVILSMMITKLQFSKATIFDEQNQGQALPL